MQPIDHFMKYIDRIEPIYETENTFTQPFYDFESRFNSLYRHWQLNKDFISNHISIIKSIDEDNYKEEFENSIQEYADNYNDLVENSDIDLVDPDDVFYDSAAFDAASDNVSTDVEYFPEYLRLSTISFALSLVENLLGCMSEELVRDFNVILELDTRPLPYINKYILWFIRGCGMDINIDKAMWKSLDAIRTVRNRFIHQINRDLSEHIKEVISEMVSNITDENNLINDNFVDSSLSKIASLIKEIEIAYIDLIEKKQI